MLIHFGDDAPMYSDVVVIIYPSRNSNWCYSQMITDGQYVWDFLTQVASKWLNIICSKKPKKYALIWLAGGFPFSPHPEKICDTTHIPLKVTPNSKQGLSGDQKEADGPTLVWPGYPLGTWLGDFIPKTSGAFCALWQSNNRK